MPDNCLWAFHFINSKNTVDEKLEACDEALTHSLLLRRRRHVLSFYLTNFIKEGITLFLVCLVYNSAEKVKKK